MRQVKKITKTTTTTDSVITMRRVGQVTLRISSRTEARNSKALPALPMETPVPPPPSDSDRERASSAGFSSSGLVVVTTSGGVVFTGAAYLVSLWGWYERQKRQYLFSSSRSGCVFL